MCRWVLILGDIVPLKYPTCCEQVFLKRAQSPGGGEGLLCTIGCFGVFVIVFFFFMHNSLVQSTAHLGYYLTVK